jgi:hypothetical protein
MVPLEALQHVEDGFLNPAGPDQGTIERALTLAIAPVSARQPVIPGQDALEDRRVAAPGAAKAARLDRSERRAAGADLSPHAGHFTVAGISRSKTASQRLKELHRGGQLPA